MNNNFDKDDFYTMEIEYSLILFDLSDVLIKGLEGSEVKIADRLKITEDQVFEQLFNFDYRPFWLGLVTENECLDSLIKKNSWSISIQELKSIIHCNFYEIPGSRDIIIKLRKKHLLVLLSVNSPEWVKELESKYKYSQLFDHIHYSYEIGYTKREPESFKFILNKYNVRPENILMIDDSTRNLSIADSVGIRGIKFLDSKQLEEKLAKMNLL